MSRAETAGASWQGDLKVERAEDGSIVVTCPNDGNGHYGIMPESGDLILIPPAANDDDGNRP